MTRRRFAAALGIALVLPLVGCAGSGAADSGATSSSSAAPDGTNAGGGPRIKLSDAYLRMPATSDVTAGYLTIRNDGDTADKLVKAGTPVADEVQVHRMSESGGEMTMKRVRDLPVPAHRTVRLTPGKLHLMLMKPHDLHQGHTVKLTLTFAKAGTHTTAAQVVPPGGAPTHTHH